MANHKTFPKPPPRVEGKTTCPDCGKLSFSSRKTAKIAMRRAHPGDRMSVYPCRRGPQGSDVKRWHYGHLAEPVKSGQAGRDTVYSGHYIQPTKEKKTMPTIAEVANITRQGPPVPLPTSPVLTQAKYTHFALSQHVLDPKNGFIEHTTPEGLHGYIGPLSFKSFFEDLVPPKEDWDSRQKHSRTRSVSSMLNRTGMVVCLDHSNKLNGVKPTYFVAAEDTEKFSRLSPGPDVNPEPAAVKASSPAPKSRTERPKRTAQPEPEPIEAASHADLIEENKRLRKAVSLFAQGIAALTGETLNG